MKKLRGTWSSITYGNIPCPKPIDLFTVFLNFWHGQVTENPSTPLKRSKVISFLKTNLPRTICTPVNFRNFAVLVRRITFKLGNFTNIKVLFPVMSTDVSLLVHVKSWKNREKVYSPVNVSVYFGALDVTEKKLRIKTIEFWQLKVICITTARMLSNSQSPFKWSKFITFL